MYSFQKINLENLNLDEYNSTSDKSIFTTKEWIEYVASITSAQPVFVRIMRDDEWIGYFTGLIFKKFGIRILGSPFDGWSSCYMGLNVRENENRLDIIKELCPYIYKELKCVYAEITDRFVNPNEAKERGFITIPLETLELEIDKSDEALFKVFKTDCRNFIRQFERRGASIEIATPDDIFAEECYKQLEDVFAKQGMLPTWPLDKLKSLLRHLAPTENLLCLRVRDPEGRSIASSVFLGYQERCFYMIGASFRPDQHYRPSEYMIWTAIKYWREQGCKILDMVGVRDYKRKFGPTEEEYVKLIVTKFPILLTLRNLAKKVFFVMLKIKGFVRKKK